MLIRQAYTLLQASGHASGPEVCHQIDSGEGVSVENQNGVHPVKQKCNLLERGTVHNVPNFVAQDEKARR